jgi:hypothetical protein
VYKLNGEDKISFVSSNYDSLQNGFSFRVSSLGKFILVQDTIPPFLEITSPVKNKTYTKNPVIRFETYDDHSGISSEENISITVDSLFVLPEWDPEEDTVFARIDEKLDAGEHKLIIKISDVCGNFSEKKIVLFIK